MLRFFLLLRRGNKIKSVQMTYLSLTIFRSSSNSGSGGSIPAYKNISISETGRAVIYIFEAFIGSRGYILWVEGNR